MVKILGDFAGEQETIRPPSGQAHDSPVPVVNY